MFKWLIMFLLISLPCQAQTITYNSNMLNYFIRNINIIESVNGDTIIGIPVEKTFKKNDKTMYVDGYLTQYSSKSDDLELKQIKCKMIIINFSTKQITSMQDSNNDILDWKRPKNLFDKVKNKLKEKEKKP